MIEPLGSLPAQVEDRPLTPTEIASLKPIFDERGVSMPEGLYMGVVRGSEILGFLVLQLKLHAEPMWIAPGESQVFGRLVAATERYILERSGPTWVYLFAPEGRVAELATAMGMTQNSEQIYYKLVQAPVAPRPFVDLQPLPFDLESLKPARDLSENPFDDSPTETIQ